MAFRKGKSSWNKGKKLTKEHRKNLSESHKGQVAWNKGIPMKEETKKKLSESKKGKLTGEHHPFYGKSHSKDSKIKMSEAQKKRFSNPEEKKRMKKLQFPKGHIPHNKGKKYSKETRKNMHRNKIEDMQEIAKSRGGECLSEEYNGSANNLRWRCKEGHEWEATPHNIKKDKWCPICSTRIGEKICRCYFEIFFKNKFPKRYPNWLKGSKGKNLELDGYCKNIKLAFEYQGEQHYKPNHYFNRNFNLEKIKQHDEFKKQKCLENNVTLIQVPYHTDYIKLGKWIEDKCKKLGFEPLESCDKIDYKKFDIYSSKKLEDIQKISKSKRGKCLADRYINNSTKLEFECEKRHIWKTTPANIKRDKWCPICSNIKQKKFWSNQFGTASKFKKVELNKIISIAEKKEGKCLSKEYVDAKSKLKFQCKEGHIFESSPDNIKHGKWCRKCSYIIRGNKRRKKL